MSNPSLVALAALIATALLTVQRLKDRGSVREEGLPDLGSLVVTLEQATEAAANAAPVPPTPVDERLAELVASVGAVRAVADSIAQKVGVGT